MTFSHGCARWVLLWGLEAPLLLHHPASLKRGPSEERAAPKNGATPGGPLGNASVWNRRSEVPPTAASCDFLFGFTQRGACAWVKTEGGTCLAYALPGPGRQTAGVRAWLRLGPARPPARCRCPAHPARPHQAPGVWRRHEGRAWGSVPVPTVRATLTAPLSLRRGAVPRGGPPPRPQQEDEAPGPDSSRDGAGRRRALWPRWRPRAGGQGCLCSAPGFRPRADVTGGKNRGFPWKDSLGDIPGAQAAPTCQHQTRGRDGEWQDDSGSGVPREKWLFLDGCDDSHLAGSVTNAG